jgi:hypothetical protein
MSELQFVESAVQKARQRLRWQRVWGGFWYAFLTGATIWLTALILYKLLPIPSVVLSISAAVGLGGVVLGCLWGARRPPSLLETARWVDRKEHLQERLSTALEMASLSAPGHWRDLLVDDAAQKARQCDLRHLLPLHLPAASRWVVVVLALSAGLGFVPEYRSKAFRQQQRDAEVIRETGRQLAELTRRTLVQHPPALPPVQQGLETVANLGDHLTQAKLTRSEALRDLSNVAEKLKQETRQLAQNPALKRLEQAARDPAGRGTTASSKLQKQIDDLQKSLGNQAGKQDALDKMKNEMQKAQEAAAGLAEKTAAGNNNAKEQLGKSLAALAQKSHDLGLTLPGLDEAIAALAGDQTELMLRDLQNALTDLEKLQAMAQALQQLQQQAEGLAKDLAEQLKKGQVDAAKNTLEKMVEKLKADDLTPEQLQKIMAEVQKAVGPAGEYGKVAMLLKQAATQMSQGQKPGAGASLAEAAKELDKLLAEMGDLESLKATLAALQQCQMGIGVGECWGTKPGGRPNGRGGRSAKGKGGFGTWAEEEGWAEAMERSELWENTPDNRGTMDSRSSTDRGEGTLADNLEATKIRGQISPGGSMPSITLKGVSIKGQSTVAYQQAAMAAQSEAQNALSQEQIPKAYQGAVKQYFDDLKK